MRVYIVTVHNSLNPGSFLQATSLYHAIEALGYEAVFLDTGARNIWKQAFIEMLYLLKNKNFVSIKEKFRSAYIYSNKLREYRCDKCYNAEEDFFVLGSDEIWNVARENMASHPVFWGENLNYLRTISYAPSLNNATEEELREHSFVLEALEKLRGISVRDSYSKETLNKITEREIQEVCDPTVLVYPERYEAISDKKGEVVGDYILVYIYNKAISESDIQAIVNFAKKHKKKTVAFGSTQKWCDMNINGSPQDFLTYIKYADYVCTSTFHGTMLSIILQKKFVVLGKKNRKVQELMSCMNIDRQADENTLEQTLIKDYDYEQCSQRLLDFKAAGIEFLKRNIEEV